jgi:hypothetical protein
MRRLLLALTCFATACTAASAAPSPRATTSEADTAAGALENRIVGTWKASNLGLGFTGVYQFGADGTFKLLSGFSEAVLVNPGFSPNATYPVSGTYKILPRADHFPNYEGQYIAFRLNDAEAGLAWTRVALVTSFDNSGLPSQIVYSVQGDTHGVEQLTRQ